MSRAQYIKQRLKARKRKLMFMRGGILGAGLCAAFFFVSMPDATSGTGGFAERETTLDPIPEDKPLNQETIVGVDSTASTIEDSITQLEKTPQIAEAQIEQAVPPVLAEREKTDREGGSRSTERENPPTTQTQSDPPPVRFESPEAVLGTPKPEVVEKPKEPTPSYMKMPSYESATLKYKLGLIGSDAYSPSDKERLTKHIIGQFASPNLPVEAVYLESGGQQSTKSFPLKLYLLRLEQNPSIRIRSIEKIQEGGSLSGLIIKE